MEFLLVRLGSKPIAWKGANRFRIAVSLAEQTRVRFIFEGKKKDIGKILPVKIKTSNRSTLFGEKIKNSDKRVA